MLNLTANPVVPDLFLTFSEDVELLLHFSYVAGGFGDLGPLQVALGEELLDVLLLLL